MSYGFKCLAIDQVHEAQFKPQSEMSKPKTKKAKRATKSDAKPDNADKREMAKTVLRPEFQSIVAMQSLFPKDERGRPEIPTRELLDEVSSITEAVTSGDMSRPERIAMAQITTLDRLFALLIEIAFQNKAEGHFESLLRVALKAQTQCARTIETLATLKNPAVITQQLNMANQQVVNNGTIQTGPQGATPNPVELPNALSEADAVNSSICAFPKSPARDPVPKKS